MEHHYRLSPRYLPAPWLRYRRRRWRQIHEILVFVLIAFVASLLPQILRFIPDF